MERFKPIIKKRIVIDGQLSFRFHYPMMFFAMFRKRRALKKHSRIGHGVLRLGKGSTALQHMYNQRRFALYTHQAQFINPLWNKSTTFKEYNAFDIVEPNTFYCSKIYFNEANQDWDDKWNIQILLSYKKKWVNLKLNQEHQLPLKIISGNFYNLNISMVKSMQLLLNTKTF